MGITLYSDSSKVSYSFDMGYGGFFSLRKNIALALDKELGELYSKIPEYTMGVNNNDADILNQRINNVLKKDVFKDKEKILDFLFSSDCGGKMDYKACGEIYQLIKDIDFTNQGFQYINNRNVNGYNDYENLKVFLLQCYKARVMARWY